MNFTLDLPLEKRLLNNAFLYTFIFLFIVFIVNLLIGYNNIEKLTIAYLLISIVLYITSIRFVGLYRIYTWVFVILYLSGINYLWFYDSGSKGSSVYGDFLPFILFCIILRGWERILITSLFIADILLLYYFEYKYPAKISVYPDNTERLLDMSTAAVIVMIFIAIIISYLIKNYELERKKALKSNADLILQQEKLKILNNNLICKNIEIERNKEEIKQYSENLAIEKANVLKIYEQKSLLFAILSHELRNPLNGILGFTELLKTDTNESDRKEYLRIIQSCGENMLFLINDILDFSKLEAKKIELQYRYFDIKPVISDIITILNIKAEMKKIELLSEINIDDNYQLCMDDLRIRQIMFNFIDNAIKFTFKGYVKIKLNTDNINTENKTLGLSIAIIDTGEGIPENEQQSIFEPYAQKKGQNAGKYKGTGLGLSIAKELIELMGGKILIESKINAGTTLTLSFPRIKYI